MRLRADGEGEQVPYEVGSSVVIESAPDPALIGQSAMVKSYACGPYYLLDVAGAGSYHPDAALSGERPAPAAQPMLEPLPPAMPDAAALARLGGATTVGQLEAAQILALGRDVLARTKASTPDAALLAVEAGLVASQQLPALRAKVTELEAAHAKAQAVDDLRARTDKLTAALRVSGLGREAFFDVAIEKYTDEAGKGRDREKLTPKAVWMRGSLADLDAALVAITAGATPIVRPRVQPDPVVVAGAEEIPAEVAEYARKRGITDPKKISAIARNHRSGSAPQEQSR